MLIIEPSAKLEWITSNALLMIEAAGRTAYQSEHSIKDDSAVPFVRKIIASGHESVLEHASASIRFITDRGVANELVRHRIASYTQSSTRYCNFSSDRFDNQIRVIQPPLSKKSSEHLWRNSIKILEDDYINLVENGERPEIARSVLPLCLATEIVCTANLREWRHIFALRLDKRAHPQMRQLMKMAFALLFAEVPVVFEQFKVDEDA